MSYKPSDFYIGIMDFFGILLPGAIILSFISIGYPCIFNPFEELLVGAVKWISFWVAAYVLGHFLFAVASLILDPIYDNIYAQAKRYRKSRLPDPDFLQIESFCVKYWFAFKSIFWYALGSSKRENLQKLYFSDALRDAASVYWQKDLHDSIIKEKYNKKGHEFISVYDWSESVVRLNNAPAIAEIEKLQAQSKFFRSISLVLLLLILDFVLNQIFPCLVETSICLMKQSMIETEATLRDELQILPFFIFLLLMLILSMWRFQKLRWTASRRVYEYFIAIRKGLMKNS